MFIANAPVPAAPEVPFTFTGPDIHRETPPDDLLGAEPAIARAMRFARDAEAKAHNVAEEVMASRAWSHEGRRNMFTHKAALVLLKEAPAYRDGLDARARTLATERDAVLRAADLSNAPAEEQARWWDLAKVIGTLPDAERHAILADAIMEKEPLLRDAMAFAHRVLSRVPAEQQERLRRLAFAARVDRGALDGIEAKVAALAAVRRELEAVMVSITTAADVDALRQAGVPLATARRTMTDAEKITFIGAHGLEGFKALPLA